MGFLDGVLNIFGKVWPSGKISELYYFDEVLPREFAVINQRRQRLWGESRSAGSGDEVAPFGTACVAKAAPERLAEDADDTPREARTSATRVRYPDPATLFRDARTIMHSGTRYGPEPAGDDAGELIDDIVSRELEGGSGGDGPPPGYTEARAKKPDRDRMRPLPVPCTATGLALSGGGIRSAAVCLGALQAIHRGGRLASVDYLSTVSGGGYIGACLSAAMSDRGGRAFPFGADVFDSPAVAHLRNFSNYLMPRNRSGGRNWAEAIAIVLRGLLANAVIVLAVLLFCVVLTAAIYPRAGLDDISMTLRLLAAPLKWTDVPLPMALPAGRFMATFLLAGGLAGILLVWAVLRTTNRFDTVAGDTFGWPLRFARYLLLATLMAAFLDLQPIAIEAVSNFGAWLAKGTGVREAVTAAWGVLTAFAGAVAAFASAIGRFLEKSNRASGFSTMLLRGLAKAALLVAALVLPLALWGLYLWLAGRALDPATAKLTGWAVPHIWPLGGEAALVRAYYLAALAALGITALLSPNAYSLHRFYRDRLSAAFVFKPPPPGSAEPESLDDLKLSELRDGDGPYHIVNAAMNVQGSTEANQRGRNADFFMMSSEFIGSDLTLYAPTRPTIAGTETMEQIDKRLNLATATAISGAAVSANMGSNTVRLLSPTLALLNIRLGYWLRNPRAAARVAPAVSPLVNLARRILGPVYLLAEMLNFLDERSAEVYLTDGGHIENLGLYELLKRGCRAVIVIDAEADPTLSFASLLKVERYARIDLGIRITLPWEQITDAARKTAADVAAGKRPCRFGPHCAVGKIIYEDETEGTLVYFKASVTGDERDYILDYKARNPDFPHETTGDQFFSEEQFEMYRALGFHLVYGFFEDKDDFALPRAHPANSFRADNPAGKALRTQERNRVRRLFPALRA